MLGLIVIGVILGYLAFSIFLIVATYKMSKRHGRRGWLPAGIVGLFMYLLVFWDHIPTLVAHKYYCDKYSGLIIYKTLEEWKPENPGAEETLVLNTEKDIPKRYGNKKIYTLNQRFVLHINKEQKLLNIVERTNQLVDSETNLPIAVLVDFDTDILPFTLGARSFRDYKGWLSMESCDSSGRYTEMNKFKKLMNEIENLGE